MSLKFSVGDLTIHRIIEQETSFVPALEMLPGLTPDVLAENRAWMREAKALDEQDVLLLCRYEKMVRPQGLQWQAWSDDHWNRAWTGMALSLIHI